MSRCSSSRFGTTNEIDDYQTEKQTNYDFDHSLLASSQHEIFDESKLRECDDLADTPRTSSVDGWSKRNSEHQVSEKNA